MPFITEIGSAVAQVVASVWFRPITVLIYIAQGREICDGIVWVAHM